MLKELATHATLFEAPDAKAVVLQTARAELVKLQPLPALKTISKQTSYDALAKLGTDDVLEVVEQLPVGMKLEAFTELQMFDALKAVIKKDESETRDCKNGNVGC